MGNTESNVTSGVKKQTDTSSILLYKLVDLKGINATVVLLINYRKIWLSMNQRMQKLNELLTTELVQKIRLAFLAFVVSFQSFIYLWLKYEASVGNRQVKC